ncbi:cobalt-precorrin-5B (C(1))-methyltransferase [Thauera propionica]|uniref:Cobalt-precorrin-5B C(1)-methyltransferase n=2 Tax=Thauera TaxID=33057 RepID=A0A235F2Q5_9RHOO|nr:MULTISPECIES: cobalt-precorrin-5B (C(1))-methyltransferase [Pseudomonadota]MDD3651920.1 cobalt-precorrin-5B (C(1))-methyltransferase [Immundisolibacter sp.]OYD55541.1 cobalt-precorrin-5B (C(1))-methyltransferase [Thauera propionica]
MAAGHALPDKVRKGDAKRDRGNRTGFSTGANSAAAAAAATLGLVQGEVPDAVECVLPNMMRVRFAVTDGHVDGDHARAVSVKDAGDDPDATHGAHLTADVCRIPGGGGSVILKGGPGVGVVTRPGLGLDVGGPAINPVPRRNIVDNVRAAGAPILEAGDSLEVTISVPGGEEMAKKTLNARLGILGGISILGTTGIVRPYSTAAFRASVIQAIDVAANQGQTSVVFTTGGRTEKCAMREFPQLDEACFVQMGDFVKAAFTTAVKQGMQHIIVGAMVGKLTKIAQGLSVTHAWREEVDRELIAAAAAEVGAPPDLVAEIRAAETARFAAERLAGLGLAAAFHRALAARAIRSLRQRYPGPHRLTVLACNFEGVPIVTVNEADLTEPTHA